jgi:phospholipid transport system substrate-binding protein
MKISFPASSSTLLVSSILLASQLVIAGSLGNAFAQSAAADIEAILRARDTQMKRILGDQEDVAGEAREALKDVVNDIIDFEEMGRRALGRYWEDLSEVERSEFVAVFGDVVRAQSLSNLDVYRSQVAYDDIQVEGPSARVFTTTVYKDVPTRVEYEMKLLNGEWSIIDIVLDDVSTANGYSRSFQSVIRKKGFPTLMDRLRKRRDREEGSDESS